MLLTEAAARWTAGEKRQVEKHIPRLTDALFREMVYFEPLGLVTPTHLHRFMDKYADEARCLFEPPFKNPTTPEEIAENRREIRAFILHAIEQGTVPRREDDPELYAPALWLAADVWRTRMAYKQAYRHVWTISGQTEPFPEEIMEFDPSMMTDADRAYDEAALAAFARQAERNAAVAAAIGPPGGASAPGDAAASAATDAAKAAGGTGDAQTARPDAPTAEGEEPEDRQPLQATEHGSPEDSPLPDADRFDWPGKTHFESPREMMRPYLEKIGRLDLLEQYSDEILRYGEPVEYRIDGKWR